MDVPVLQLAKIMVYHSNVYLCSNSTLIAASFCVNLEPAASTLKEIENGLREVTDYNLISAKPNWMEFRKSTPMMSSAAKLRF